VSLKNKKLNFIVFLFRLPFSFDAKEKGNWQALACHTNKKLQKKRQLLNCPNPPKV